ncbi:hypothetical protein V6U89_17985 [Micromonospora sp. CPCC 206171]|uniref:hypothetical protein n=1 Tax=Micromonospora sp. CPCC 206171 TaxID=3122405 RepID=UPI002FEF40E7
MTGMPWPLTLLGLPLWFGPPFLLLITVSRARVVRIASGAMLAAALTFLYAVVGQLLQGPWLPTWIEGLVLWGPTTLVVCGAAVLADRWMSRRQASGVGTGSGATGSGPVARRRAGPLLVAAFVGWSACCGGCVLSPATEFVDLRIDSPTPGLVLPMPADLTLVSAGRDCGSQLCSEVYRVGSPDQASVPELTDRLWAHLVGTKGWERLRPDAGCQRPGWFIQEEFCLFVDVEQAGSVAVLEVHVTGALTVA